jgi:hypothetical protein
LVNLKTKAAGDGYPRKAIEKTVLRFLGPRTFSHGLDPLRTLGLFYDLLRRTLAFTRRSTSSGLRSASAAPLSFDMVAVVPQAI